MKLLSMMLFVLLSLSSLTINATDRGTISFQGNIVNVPVGQSVTKVTPTTTHDAAQSPQTVYVVSSVISGRILATFSTEKAANAYASQVTPTLAASP